MVRAAVAALRPATRSGVWERPLGPLEPSARFLVVAALLLMGLGLVMVYSASITGASELLGDGSVYLRRQTVWALIGVTALVLAMRVDLARIEALAKPALIISIVLLAVVVLPFVGHEVNGARRWLRAGPFSFQPSELAKLALIAWLARHLTRRARHLDDWRTGTLPAIVPIAITAFLILVEPDFGTALFVGAVGVAMLLVGGVPLSRLALLAAMSTPVLAWQVVERWDTFVTRFQAVGGGALDTRAAYQVHQGLIALGSGGLTGRGLGAGRQKLFFLPEARTDFILPVVGEELGFIGTAAVVVLFGLIVACGLRIALGAARRDRFGFLLTFGLVFWVGLQAAGNVAVVTASVPTKGIALPFISLGGSSLVVLCTAVGLVYAVARRVDARAAADARAPLSARGLGTQAVVS